jgi:hypothetical protein
MPQRQLAAMAIGRILIVRETPLRLQSPPGEAAEKLLSEGVILSEAKDLMSARAASKADPKRKIGATSG